LKARLVKAWDLTPDVRHFEFEAVGVSGFAFTPGQFVPILAQVDGQEITRAYSIASTPAGNRFALCLNLVADGHVSPMLFALEPGGEIEIGAPLGFFLLRQPPSDSLMIATGTGIAPMRSILPGTLDEHPDKQFTLLFGTRTPETILYRDEFEALEKSHANFHFWPTLSRASADWTGRRGHVQSHLVEALGERRDMDVYVCGLRAMVDDVRTRLKEMGFDRKRIVTERYD
jgi:CDP-4-dehydro-6-deoxyglucose reductase